MFSIAEAMAKDKKLETMRAQAFVAAMLERPALSKRAEPGQGKCRIIEPYVGIKKRMRALRRGIISAKSS